MWVKSNITPNSIKTFVIKSSKEIWYYNIPIVDTNMNIMWQKLKIFVREEYQRFKITVF